MDDKSTIKPIAPLYLRVRMVPERAMLIIADGKLVREVSPWWNCALSKTHCAVHVVITFHEQPVPVNGNTIVSGLKLVLDVHDEGVA